MKQRMISLCMVIVLLLSMFPAAILIANAAVTIKSGTCGDNLTWTLSDEGILTISGSGPMWEFGYMKDVPWLDSIYSIRSVIIETGVTTIGYGAFSDCYQLESVSIPNTVTLIDAFAFSLCFSLSYVRIPSSVTQIEEWAFYACDELERIDVDADNPAYCNDDSGVLYSKDRTVLVQAPGMINGAYAIPDGTSTIADFAFSACNNLVSVTIPSSVTAIGDEAFELCTALEGIWVDAGNPNYSNDNYGVLFNRDKTILLRAPGAFSGSYAIPNSVTTIGHSAFAYCDSLTNATIPNSVISIESNAFFSCNNLTSVTIPSGVTNIGIQAFDDCIKLTAIKVSEDNSCYSSDYRGVLLNKEQTEILQVPQGLTGEYTIPNSVHAINEWTFGVRLCLTSIIIPNSVSYIDHHAFSDCYCLTNVTIPNSVASIGDWAFDHCNSLTDVYFTGTEAQWNAISIGEGNECLSNATIHFESEMLDDPIAGYDPITIVDDFARTEWIEQHMDYAASDEYQSEIVSGFSDQMLAIFRDALNDEEIQSYNARKALSAVLRVDVEFDDADVFEALIAQVLYGKGGRELAELAFEENYQMVISDLTKSLVNAVNSSDAVKEVSKDTRDSINEIYKLLQTLEYGSDEYGKTLRTFFGQFKNNGADILKTWKTELIGDAAFTGLGIVIDGAFEQYDAMEDIVTYLSNYIAYQNMSEQTREVLVRLAVNVMYNYEDWHVVDELIDELGFLNSAKNWSAFETALLSVIDAMADYEQKGAAAIAEYAVERERAAGERFASKTVKTVKIFAIEKIASCIPIVNTILIAKNVTSAVLDVSILLDQILTNVDDRAYALDVLTKTYCISVMLDKTVEDCADSMSDDDFYSTTVFDESVSIYKKNLLLASGYASKYTHMVLARAFELYEKYMEEDEAVFNLHREKLFEIISTYSNHLDGIMTQKAEIQEIICHDSDLRYNPLTDEIVYNLEDCRIYVVACPVDVIVTTDTGEQIAYLSGVDNQVSEGHEFYFHTIEAANDPGEYIKVAIVPNNYRIDLKGTDDGIMHVLVADFTTGNTGLVETYFNIPIKKDSIGYFEDVSEDSDEGSLVVDQVSYSNMESAEDIPTDSARNHVWIWIIGGLIICGIILGVLPQKKI